MTQIEIQPSSSLSNVLSGGAIRIIRALLQVVITPFIIKLLGPEQYGLIAFSLTLQMLFFIFDQAMSPAVIREFGILGYKAEHVGRLKSMFFTFERFSFVIGFLLAIIIFLSSSFIAQDWLQAKALSPEKVKLALCLIGVNLAFQWPALLYNGCFIGLHQQSVLAKVTISISLIQAAVSLFVLYLFKGDVILYITVQAFFSLSLTILLRSQLIKSMPSSDEKPSFDFSLLKEFRKFAGGTFLIAITTTLLSQADKIFLSRFVTLDQFAAYSISFMIGSNVISLVNAPFINALMPHFSELYASGDQDVLQREYHKWAQMVSFFLFPLGGFLIFYAQPLVSLWLGHGSELVTLIAVIMPVIVFGFVINAIVSVPCTLQIASGKISMLVYTNSFAFILVVAALWIFVPFYGVYAGAYIWLALNLFYMFVWSPIAHSMVISGQYQRWVLFDVGFPLFITALIFFACDFFISRSDNNWILVLQGSIVSCLSALFLYFVLNNARSVVNAFYYKAMKRI